MLHKQSLRPDFFSTVFIFVQLAFYAARGFVANPLRDDVSESVVHRRLRPYYRNGSFPLTRTLFADHPERRRFPRQLEADAYARQGSRSDGSDQQQQKRPDRLSYSNGTEFDDDYDRSELEQRRSYAARKTQERRLRNQYAGGDYDYSRESESEYFLQQGPYPHEDKECRYVTRQTKSSLNSLPITSGSAVVSLPMGSFVLYCTQNPNGKILTFPLYCNEEANNGHAAGTGGIVTDIEHPCHQLKVVEDRNNLQNPAHFVIPLTKGYYTRPYRVDYDTGGFTLFPALEAFYFKYLTDVETVFFGGAGTVLLFANDNQEAGAPFADTLAPIYLVKHGEIRLCGFTDIQNTRKVTAWKRPDKTSSMIVAYLQQRSGTRRSLLHFFEIRLHRGHCVSRHYEYQQTLGAAEYRGGRNTQCAYEPFTVDHCLCGAQDIKFVSSKGYQTSHLVIGLSLRAEKENDACPVSERIMPENAFDKSFCCCPHANQYSFLLDYSHESRKFGKSGRHGVLDLRSLQGDSAAVTEIREIKTESCCNIFQTSSPSGRTELYSIEPDDDGFPQLFQFIDHGLPPYAHSSSLGYCDTNDVIVSYDLHAFQSDNTIFHIKCSKDTPFHPSSTRHSPNMSLAEHRSQSKWLDYRSAYYSQQPYNRSTLNAHPKAGSVYSPLPHAPTRYQSYRFRNLPSEPRWSSSSADHGRLSAIHPDSDDYYSRNMTGIGSSRRKPRDYPYPAPPNPRYMRPPSEPRKRFSSYPPGMPLAHFNPNPYRTTAKSPTIRVNSTTDLNISPIPTYSLYIFTGKNDTDSRPYRPPYLVPNGQHTIHPGIRYNETA
ncbi:uncharacterized protein LOC129583939 [Paramacrobiotus metropolitanus]|uniref:uncharacterized protein LOC129583939 n=1 Tax=Paramacrobiotus metropolitanus TaxID=2943436 RepID=UPI00244609A6|nr:uncharacterized protein LOC129583939 [Paramacrobiotus metropolitanus]